MSHRGYRNAAAQVQNVFFCLKSVVVSLILSFSRLQTCQSTNDLHTNYSRVFIYFNFFLKKRLFIWIVDKEVAFSMLGASGEFTMTVQGSLAGLYKGKSKKCACKNRWWIDDTPLKRFVSCLAVYGSKDLQLDIMADAAVSPWQIPQKQDDFVN